MTRRERADALLRFVDALEADREVLARLVTMEGVPTRRRNRRLLEGITHTKLRQFAGEAAALDVDRGRSKGAAGRLARAAPVNRRDPDRRLRPGAGNSAERRGRCRPGGRLCATPHSGARCGNSWRGGAASQHSRSSARRCRRGTATMTSRCSGPSTQAPRPTVPAAGPGGDPVGDQIWQAFVTKRRRFGPVTFDRRALEVCLFVHLTGALEVGYLSVVGAEAFADYRAQLLPWDECEARLPAHCAATGIPSRSEDFAAALKVKLTTLAAAMDAGFPGNAELSLDAEGTAHLKHLETAGQPPEMAESEQGSAPVRRSATSSTSSNGPSTGPATPATSGRPPAPIPSSPTPSSETCSPCSATTATLARLDCPARAKGRVSPGAAAGQCQARHRGQAGSRDGRYHRPL